MATIRMILFDEEYNQLDVVDVPLGKTTSEVGAGAVIKAARQFFWENYMIPDLKPLLQTRAVLLKQLEEAVRVLQRLSLPAGVMLRAEPDSFDLGVMRVAITEARMVDDSATPWLKKEK
jgi:hypothetical protein